MARHTHHQRLFKQRDGNGFHLSIGDLMSALLFIVVLVLVSTMTQLGALAVELRERNEQVETITRTVETIAADYENTRQAIVAALLEEFREDFETWGAELLEESLTIRFTEDGTFAPNSAVLTPRFQEVIGDFMPRYVAVLFQPSFRDYITDVLIEGHTANPPPGSFSFINSMNLAFNRSLNVLVPAYRSVDQQSSAELEGRQQWFENRIGVGGYSHGRPVLDSTETIDWDNSRRVDFRIITNADEQLDRILRSFNAE